MSSGIGKAVATFLNFYVSHGSATRFLRNSKNCYVFYAVSSLLFTMVKEFSKVDEVIAISSTPCFLYTLYITYRYMTLHTGTVPHFARLL